MLDFVCTMPGLDAATAAWHGLIHAMLTGVVGLGGLVFLVLGAVAHVRSAPSRLPPAGQADR